MYIHIHPRLGGVRPTGTSFRVVCVCEGALSGCHVEGRFCPGSCGRFCFCPLCVGKWRDGKSYRKIDGEIGRDG